MLHDDAIYSNPTSFQPERYLDSEGKLKTLERIEDPSRIVFGFGRRFVPYPYLSLEPAMIYRSFVSIRRICPGMFLAENAVFLYIASLLYVFKIVNAKDSMGRDIEPEVDYDGFLRCADRLLPKVSSTD